ncbi:hypothetical protein [Nocardia yamanashiensis]|uniref:hypothetical protein n=1 Tax=Nocardia yamanashiensis TaxID=209247 RepID=UPI00082BFCA8|nr:hypothetical protein [Nocardia yamanashiensis]
MDQDQLTARANELATQLGVSQPRLKFARLPKSWFPGGIWVRILIARPHIHISPTFATLSTPEQDAELARAVVASDILKSSLIKFTGALVFLIALPTALLVLPVTALIATFDLFHRASLTLSETITVLPVLGYGLLAQIAWERRIVYRTDRILAESLGHPLLSTIHNLSRRLRYKRRGLTGMLLSLCIPNENKRADAIADLAPTPA